MPNNINHIKNNLPFNTIYQLQNHHIIPYPLQYNLKRHWPKILIGLGTIGGFYGAYKLGQRNPNNNKFTKTIRYPKMNYTRSGS